MADIINILSGIAGVTGAVTGIISLAQVRKVKSLDLRMERGRLLNAIQVTLDGINDFADKANQSRVYRFAAQGLAKSGSMQKWQAAYEKDKQSISDLSEKFLSLKDSTVSAGKLDSHILELHLIEERLKSLTDGFAASIAEDDVARDRIARMKFGT